MTLPPFQRKGYGKLLIAFSEFTAPVIDKEYALVLWRGVSKGQFPSPCKFWAIRKLWKCLHLARKFLVRKSKFGPENQPPILGKFRGQN